MYRKKYLEKVNINTINWEEIFDRSAGQKKLLQYTVTR